MAEFGRLYRSFIRVEGYGFLKPLHTKVYGVMVLDRLERMIPICGDRGD